MAKQNEMKKSTFSAVFAQTWTQIQTQSFPCHGALPESLNLFLPVSSDV